MYPIDIRLSGDETVFWLNQATDPEMNFIGPTAVEIRLFGGILISARMFAFENGVRVMSGKRGGPRSRVGARDSGTGQFIPVREADRRPATTQKERIPLPGYGDTGRSKGKK